MIPFFKKTKYFFVLILISFIAGCSSDNDENLPAVTAAFTYFIDGTTGTVEFTNTSTNADSYFWDLGNNNTTTEENPIDTYTESGEYTVQLIAKNLAGGSDTISQIIEISLPDVPVIETVTLPLDFELDATNYEITDFDGGNLTIVANPFSDDTNSSAQVGKMIKNDGQTWGGSAITLEEAIDFSTNTTFQMKVYSPRTGAKVLLKVENADDSSISYEVETETTVANEWETLTFDYSGVDTSQTYNKVILIFDNGTAGDGSDNFTFYVDDIELVSGSGTDTTAPATAAPTPTQDAANVISIYSDTYTAISGVDYNPAWNQSTVQSEVAIDGNNTMLYTGLNYQGIDFSGNAQDVSGMTYLHIDYWTQNSTTLNTYLISSGPVEAAKALTVPTSGWVSIDIPLTDFSSVNLTDVIQMKFDGDGDIYLDNIYFYSESGAGDTTAPVITLVGDATMNVTVGDTFTDPGVTASDDTDGDITANVVVAGDTVDTNTAGTYVITYNVSDAAGNAATEVTRTVVVSEPSTSPNIAAPTPTQDAANVISIYSNTYGNASNLDLNPGWGQATLLSEVTAGTDVNTIKLNNLNYQGGQYDVINASSMEFLHMDIWVASGNDTRTIKFSPINNGSGAGEFLVEIPVIPGSWNSVDLPKSSFTGMTWDAIFQYKFDAQFNADGTANTDPVPYDVFIDNIYFYNNGSGGGTDPDAPTVAAPIPPTRNAADVVSLFSDAYSNITIDTWSAAWDDSDIEDITVDGNNTKKISFTNFIGVDFQSSRFDATSMTHFHIDFWTNETNFDGKVFNSKFSNWSGGTGETSAVELNINAGTTPPLASGQWVSVDLALDSAINPTRDDLVQFLITSNLGVVYVDNIYLYK